MTKSKQKLYARLNATKKWKKYFRIKYKRYPTKEECLAFGVGFNSGYNKYKQEKQWNASRNAHYNGKALEVCENCYGKIKRDKKSTGNKAGRPNKMMDILIETQKRVNKKNGNK